MRGLRLHSWRLLASRDECPAGTVVGPLKATEGIESHARAANCRRVYDRAGPHVKPYANRVSARAFSRRPTWCFRVTDIGPTIAALLSDDNRRVNAQRTDVSGGMVRRTLTFAGRPDTIDALSRRPPGPPGGRFVLVHPPKGNHLK